MSVTPSCLTWLQIYKVFLHYEQVESSWRWPQQLPGVANGWCAQNTIPQGGACPVEGTCWPGCVEAIGVPQEGLVPEWCLPSLGAYESGVRFSFQTGKHQNGC